MSRRTSIRSKPKKKLTSEENIRGMKTGVGGVGGNLGEGPKERQRHAYEMTL